MERERERFQSKNYIDISCHPFATFTDPKSGKFAQWTVCKPNGLQPVAHEKHSLAPVAPGFTNGELDLSTAELVITKTSSTSSAKFTCQRQTYHRSSQVQ